GRSRRRLQSRLSSSGSSFHLDARRVCGDDDKSAFPPMQAAVPVRAEFGYMMSKMNKNRPDDPSIEHAAPRDPDSIRADVAEVLDRHALTLDAARPEAVARRRKTHQRTARENVDDICDPGT